MRRLCCSGLLLALALTAAACSSDSKPDPNAGKTPEPGAPDADTPTPDGGAPTTTAGVEPPAPQCKEWSDCPAPRVCRKGQCAEPVFPKQSADATRRVTINDPAGNMIVNGRLLRPAAPVVRLNTFPTRMRLSPDGRHIAVNENGFGTVTDPSNFERKTHMIRWLDAATLEIKQTIPMPNRSSYIGLLFDKAGKRLFASGGKDSQVHIFPVENGLLGKPSKVDAPGCFVADFALSADESRLYVTCELQGTVLDVDLASNKVLETVKAGINPYMISISPDGQRLWVSNWTTTARPKEGDTVTVLKTTPALEYAGRVNVGLSPIGQAWSPDGSRMYVVCNKTDDIHEIDAAAIKTNRVISLHGDPKAVKGIGPTMLAISRDGKTLYANGAGENLVAVVDVASGQTRGLIPTEWYPTDVLLNGDSLAVLSGKGVGDGPTKYTGKGVHSEDREQSGRTTRGSIMQLPLPDDAALAAFTRTVNENNNRQSTYFDHSAGNDTPVPSPGEDRKSPIKHVFLILKENFSYDAAYGDKGLGEGDPKYALWGEDVIPNQLKLAREYAIFDNFHADSESSIDGHQWAAAGIEPDFVEKGWVMEYAGWGLPTILVSLTPGSIPASEFFMPHLIKQGLTVYGYGGTENFGSEVAGRYRNNYMLEYPFNLGRKWTDKDRGELFRKEFAGRLKNGTVPAFSWIFLPNNHGFGLSVGDLVPDHWVADNDEGVGLVVDAIANSPIWKDSVIFIFEDDAQSGFDHVDMHRSPALAIGPWVKKGYVSSVAYSMPNIHRTIELILGATPMNRFDAGASGMYDVFLARPDVRPFERIPRKFPEKRYDGKENRLTRWSKRMNWDEIDQNPDAAEFLWWYKKGAPPPYPLPRETDGD
ncbi:MAG: hypothetical protein GMKNLPBB_01580 [Myxococcota bacterium]|nr:hypothetical protein [Myxococcota bacterium]